MQAHRRPAQLNGSAFVPSTWPTSEIHTLADKESSAAWAEFDDDDTTHRLRPLMDDDVDTTTTEVLLRRRAEAWGTQPVVIDDVHRERDDNAAPIPLVRSSRVPMLWAGVGFLVTLGAMAFGWALVDKSHMAVAVKSATLRAAAVVRPRVTENTAAALSVQNLRPASVGVVRLPERARGHRVFVDGRVQGHGAASLTLDCGEHTVRIGSGGRVEAVDVPCGGDVRIP